MTLRDDLLSVANELRGIPAEFGLRRFSVTLRRRIWSEAYAGDGAVTVEDLVILPPPRVRAVTATDRQALDILVTGSYATTEFYNIDRITPKFLAAGFTPNELRAKRNAETQNIEPFVILVGDDGFQRECVQVYLGDDRALHYSMIVQKTDRKAVMISSLSITPNPAALDQTKKPSLQLTATGIFEDASTSDISPLVSWTVTDPRVATVNSLGVVTAIASGSTSVHAEFRGLQASVPIQVVL